MEVFEIVDELEKWDELVKNSTHGTIFHRSDWLTTCSSLMNKELKLYGCFDHDKLIGGCSLYVRRLKFFKIASSEADFNPYGGIVLAESPSSKIREQEQTYNHFINSLLNKIDKEHFDHIQIVNSPEFIDVRPFIWDRWNFRILYTYYLDLNADIEKSISKNARRDIKKAIKNNIVSKKLNDPHIFYELFSMTFRRQGLKPLVAQDFFEKIINLLEEKQLGEMWVAETPSGEAISAEIVVWDDKKAYRWAAASHSDFRDSGASSLLLYEIFKDIKNKGFKEINLMAANTPRIAKFISQFNPLLIPYYQIEKTNLMFKCFKETYSFYEKLRNSF